MPGPGADPSKAECYESFREHLDYVDERDQIGSSNSPSVYDLYDAAEQDAGGRFMIAALAELDADRRRTGELLSPERLQAIIDPHLREILRFHSLPRSGNYADRLFRWIEQLNADSDLFQSRNMTLGSPTFDSTAVGTGAIRRCTVDRYGNTLECTGAEAKRAEVIRDQGNGVRRHRELFRFEGATPATDQLDWLGSGILAEVPAFDCLSGDNLVQNPSFESGASTTDDTALTSTTQISGWTVAGTASNFNSRAEAENATSPTLFYRGYAGGPSGTNKLISLEFQASETITQDVTRVSPGARWREDRPYYCHVAWQRLASATGTLKFRVGAIETTVDVSTGTNGVWNLLIATIGQNSWYRQLKTDNMQVAIEMDTLATGTVLIDDVMVKPMVPVDGTYYLPVGARTPFAKDDFATWTDTEDATRARFSYWLWRSLLGRPQAAKFLAMGGVWIPTTTTASSITIAD